MTNKVATVNEALWKLLFLFSHEHGIQQSHVPFVPGIIRISLVSVGGTGITAGLDDAGNVNVLVIVVIFPSCGTVLFAFALGGIEIFVVSLVAGFMFSAFPLAEVDAVRLVSSIT